MARDGRKLRFFYHVDCFSGDADPRTQTNSSFETKPEYHEKSAPKVSSLEGPRALKDADGRELGRTVFKDKAPSVIGAGKWSVANRGFVPSPFYQTPAASSASSLALSESRRSFSSDRNQNNHQFHSSESESSPILLLSKSSKPSKKMADDQISSQSPHRLSLSAIKK
jgi:hypothetical protein